MVTAGWFRGLQQYCTLSYEIYFSALLHVHFAGTFYGGGAYVPAHFGASCVEMYDSSGYAMVDEPCTRNIPYFLCEW